MSDELFGGFLKPQKEDEQKFISYLLRNPDCISTLSKEAFYDKTCRYLFESIENVIKDGLTVEVDIVYDYAKKYEIEKTTIKDIYNSFSDFSNIDSYTIPRIQEFYTKKWISQQLDFLVEESIQNGTPNFERIQVIADDIIKGSYELKNDSFLLTSETLVRNYRKTLEDRKKPSSIKTFGFECIDSMCTRPAAPEELSLIIGRKGSSKSLVLKTIENSLINQGICVVSFNMEMSETSNMDRIISMRSHVPLKDLLKTRKDRKMLLKIDEELKKFEQLKNYIYYGEPSLTLKQLDDYLGKAKKKFKERGVLPDDGYMFVTLDLLSMVKEFSGKDAYALQEAVDKLSEINRKHKCHIMGLLQSNESDIRGGKRFSNPEQIDNYTLTMENTFGGSAYSARARIMFAVNRPLLLKRQFFPNRREEWDLETDITWLNVIKENDGDGKLGRTSFVFPDNAFRLMPFKL